MALGSCLRLLLLGSSSSVMLFFSEGHGSKGRKPQLPRGQDWFCTTQIRSHRARPSRTAACGLIETSQHLTVFLAKAYKTISQPGFWARSGLKSRQAPFPHVRLFRKEAGSTLPSLPLFPMSQEPLRPPIPSTALGRMRVPEAWAAVSYHACFSASPHSGH